MKASGGAASAVGSAWRVDLHMHTNASRDSMTEPAALIKRARQAGLQRVAITDHNTIAGALVAQRLAPDLVIVGEEIRTAGGGELLAYYVSEEIPRGLPAQEVIRRLREQGAVISVSHPVDRFRKHSAFGEARVLEILEWVDALEVFNARCLLGADNRQAARIAAKYGLACTAGSDAHTLGEIGAGYLTVAPFADAPAAFLASLQQAQAGGRLTGIWPHFASTLARRRASR